MVLFPHLAAGLPQSTRITWSWRRRFLIIPVLVIVGFVAFVYMGGVDIVPANYRPAFDFSALLPGSAGSSGSSSTSSAPPAVPTFSDPRAPISTSPEKDHHSTYSFDINGGPDKDLFSDWMALAPDDLSLAHMSIPGTHDTMTHNIDLLGYRCQNADLDKQLMGGVRYLDIRARVQIDLTTDDLVSDGPRTLGIYHARAYTGYSFGDVLQTVAGFLDAHPSETIVMRLKEEGPPINGSAHDAAGLTADDGTALNVPSKSGAPFLDAFENYLQNDGHLQSHLFQYAEAREGAVGVQHIPTLGELRGKVLLLQEFPYFPQSMSYTGRPSAVPMYGIPWYLESDLLAVEDKWIMRNLDDLDGKWDAVKASLRAAAKQAVDNKADAGSGPNPKLYLSHLSASIGVTPIDAATGPTNQSTEGINDRTGAFVDRGKELYSDDYADVYTPVGIVMADFPGMRLMRTLIKRNKHMNT
ncbi:phosphatidylinositol-specific phospholipase c [Ophiostoma piceae UAMH 11346]|uniref:Phosphatidylinositol-specific phospholipase c n=1 Tax=Ophiostoma piceae (strain UAMH 11346) TaxID=1262450 RepID=S3BM04_OPHP1|nr:phosphatidylinositol-specific phospholipase c [Ophiostoma piceae UAMH 11346]